VTRTRWQENVAMLGSLLACGGMLFAGASERWPALNGTLKLVALPDEQFRAHLLMLLVVSVFGTLLWDRLVTLVFAPRIVIIGHVDAWRALPSLAGLLHACAVYGFWVAIVALWIATDNLFVLGAGWFAWRSAPMKRFRGVE
jgi:hypothetical protein